MIASRIPLISALLLGGVLFAAAGPARASVPDKTPHTAPAEQEEGLRMQLLSRKLFTRVQEHREHLARIDNLTEFFRKSGQLEKIREMEQLRQREIAAFQRTLAEYRRVLGNTDFERVARAVRFLMGQEQRIDNIRYDLGDSVAQQEPLRSRDILERRAKAASAQRPPSADRSLQRSMLLERARASQKMQLAQRLKQAREQQLRQMAEQQRRYRPSAGQVPGAGGGPTRPAAGTQQGGGATRRGNATPPATTRPAPQRRKP